MQDCDFALPLSHQGTTHRYPTFTFWMEKVEDYRSHAEECRTMARRARSAQERDMLLNMARTWDDLSIHRAEQIARQKRIAALLSGSDRMNGDPIPGDQLNANNDE
jgi:hypothetical protein